MSKIKIKNFGPIRDGYKEGDGFIDIKKVTVFIGNQGSGKSTIAKLISTFKWMEKATRRGGDINSFENSLLKYHRIHNYSNVFDEKRTHILEYEGAAYNINVDAFLHPTVAQQINSNNYRLPKIMYVPSERNFITAVERVSSNFKYLPDFLVEFLDEYDIALDSSGGFIDLPRGFNVTIEYKGDLDEVYLVGKDYRIRLSEASSGFQSLVPQFVVSQFLANYVRRNSKSNRDISPLFTEEVKKIYADANLTDEQKRIAVSEFAKNKINPSAFVNIVEEPEQNLFPDSQRHVLNSLLEFNNMSEGNELIITTHSPYIVNYLSIAIQGYELLQKIRNSNGNQEELKNRLEKIVPISSVISSDDVVVYQLNENDGTITRLPSIEGIPSDKNLLNSGLAKGNELFDSLLEIEEDL